MGFYFSSCIAHVYSVFGCEYQVNKRAFGNPVVERNVKWFKTYHTKIWRYVLAEMASEIGNDDDDDDRGAAGGFFVSAAVIVS